MYTRIFFGVFVCVVVFFEFCDGACVPYNGVPGVCICSVIISKTNGCPKGKKTCVKIERRPVCCKGYEYADSKCRPICKSGCSNGTCIAPDKCQCDAPYLLQNSTCVLPTCHPPCVNSKCIAKDTCECIEGFTNINKTYCGPTCPSGYFNNPIDCKPKCDQPCANGTCIEPNICNCNLGYKNDPGNKFNCLPNCEPECVNADCVSPNTCSCYKNYKMAGNGICRPQCEDCTNGECVAPNECRCREGYSMNNRTCTPNCSKECVNGYCSKPETCECNAGFNLTSSDKYICEPTCSSGCINATCNAPEECKCLPGYEATDDVKVCKPSCDACENGTCVAPNKCECNDGYEMTDGVCKPICTNFCVNGDCIAPNKCSCYEGFRENETLSHICYKPCEGPCDDGICYLDGKCLCNQGFEYDTINKTCIRMAEVPCKSCNITCIESPCFCGDGAPCYVLLSEPDEVTSSRLASMEMTWILGGAVLVLLVILVVAVMIQTWRRRPLGEAKAQDDGGQYMSVGFIAPHTLKNRTIPGEDYKDEFYEELPLKSDNEEAERNERFRPIE